VIASFLTRLRKAVPSQRPKAAGVPEYPLGLQPDQVQDLRHLVSTPQWRTYTEALHKVCEQGMAQILSGLPQEQYLLLCGRTQALLDVLSLPETIDQKSREIDEHNRPASPIASGKRDLTFFGSPFWSPSRAPSIHKPDVDRSRNGTGMGEG